MIAKLAWTGRGSLNLLLFIKLAFGGHVSLKSSSIQSTLGYIGQVSLI